MAKLYQILSATLLALSITGCYKNFKPVREDQNRNPPPYRSEDFYEKEFIDRPKAIDPPYWEIKEENPNEKNKDNRGKPTDSLEEVLA